MNDLINFLISEFKNKKGGINYKKIKMVENKKYMEQLINITNFLPEKVELRYRFNYIKNGYLIPKLCKRCDNILIDVNKKYCSNNCATQDDDYKKNMKKVWNDKSESEIKIIQDKRKKTNNIKYGVDIASKLSEVIEKNKMTHFKNWGNYAINIKEIKDKRENTCNEKWGGIGMASKIIMKKIKNTNVKNYGVEYYSMTSDWYDKCVSTCIDKYGKDWISKVNEINIKQQSGGYSWYDFEMPSGKIYRLQGYEPRVVLDLLSKYKEDDIIIGLQNINNEIGFFNYFYNGDNHRYYPDIYIKSEQLVIEVKSNWTFNKEKEKNLLKRQSILDKNLKFKFIIL